MRLRQSRRFDRSRSMTFEANSLTNVSKLLPLALVAGLFAGCAATRPISDVALQRLGGRLRPLVRHGEASSGVGRLFEFVHDRDGEVLRADCIADRAV